MKAIQTVQEALVIAREFARNHDVNEGRAEAFTEVWFDAGKDYDASSPDDLRAYLRRKFAL